MQDNRTHSSRVALGWRRLKLQQKPPKIETKDEEPEVLFCLHCRSETHRIEDCAAYKVAQAKRRKVWCERCKQYGHTMADCLDEKQEQRNREIERENIKKETAVRRNR